MRKITDPKPPSRRGRGKALCPGGGTSERPGTGDRGAHHPPPGPGCAAGARAIRWVYSVLVRLRSEPEEPAETYEIPRLTAEGPARWSRVFRTGGHFCRVGAGSGGAEPLVLERGPEMAERQRAVEAFRAGGVFDPEANVQFGEGGAGAFSDGSSAPARTTGASPGCSVPSSSTGRSPPSPTTPTHLGTDVLSRVVVNIRREIEALGGDLRFRTRLDGLDIRGGELQGLRPSCGREDEYLSTDRLILATGHSARDTFKMLLEAGLRWSRRPFHGRKDRAPASGDRPCAVRRAARKRLPAADYGLNVTPAGRARVYTFCMCPGGVVINAASEPGGNP